MMHHNRHEHCCQHNWIYCSNCRVYYCDKCDEERSNPFGLSPLPYERIRPDVWYGVTKENVNIPKVFSVTCKHE